MKNNLIILNKINFFKKNINYFKKINNFKNNNHIIYLYVKSYLNAKRLGNSKTKERSEVKGSTRKIQKQKGTGNARKGDIKNPLFKGGGRVFGPKKRNYKIKINKKIYKYIKKILFCNKILNNKIFFLKKFNFLSHKTKYFINFFLKKKIKINNKKKKILIITDKIYNKLLLASRNLKNININWINNINLYKLLISDYVIIIGNNIHIYIYNIIKKK
ncbi:MAG: 50S ribosomal protein L4 [Candidatus Shikimatogenerans bostrichidophilus]|nr:MAG: 50S ribosomal protein L4 [Candidatus Shikimatogenerans bostrichidophilus]